LVRTSIILLCCLACSRGNSQQTLDSILNKINPQKWSASVEKNLNKLEDKIIAKSEKTLRSLQKQEEKIYKKQLSTKDSLIAKAKLAEIEERYKAIKDKLKNPVLVLPNATKQYFPHFDTLKTAFKFLDQNAGTPGIKEALSKIELFEGRMQQAEEVKKFIRERRDQLKQQLEHLGLVKDLKRINKEVYYYSAQINEYKSIFKDSKKLEQKAISLLNKMPAFTQFMKKHSELAGLFGPQGNYTTIQGQTGLQPRVQVISFIQNQTGLTSSSAQSLVRKNIQSAQGQIDQLRSMLNSYGGGSGNLDMPDFKPKNQKIKSFFRRLEYGTNLQTARSTSFFPITTDLGLSAGYRLNDKNIVGISATYKIGWGKNLSNIKLSSEGVGFRSFADINIKKSLFISGGFEYNYQQPFSSLSVLNNLDNWQKSGLIGVTKIVSLNTKVFKKTKVQFLWDFLSYRERPRGQAIKFRVGYSF